MTRRRGRKNAWVEGDPFPKKFFATFELNTNYWDSDGKTLNTVNPFLYAVAWGGGTDDIETVIRGTWINAKTV